MFRAFWWASMVDLVAFFRMQMTNKKQNSIVYSKHIHFVSEWLERPTQLPAVARPARSSCAIVRLSVISSFCRQVFGCSFNFLVLSSISLFFVFNICFSRFVSSVLASEKSEEFQCTFYFRSFDERISIKYDRNRIFELNINRRQKELVWIFAFCTCTKRPKSESISFLIESHEHPKFQSNGKCQKQREKKNVSFFSQSNNFLSSEWIWNEFVLRNLKYAHVIRSHLRTQVNN